MAIEVLLVEDHEMVRAGLKSLLNEALGISVAGEAANGREALLFIRQKPVDVVIMDITMPGLNGFEATSRIKRISPKTQVLMLSMYASEEYVVQAIRQGATGYLVKDAVAPELEKAIRAVARDERYLGSSLDSARIEHLLETSSNFSGPLVQLTPRQREILQLVVEGNKTREIAEILAVSVKTVETHRAQLMDRLGIRDVAGLVRYAIRFGLVSPHY